MRFDSRSSVKASGARTASDRPPATTAAAAEELLAEELARCGDCGRTPLIGEHVHLYPSADLVCELCRMLRPQAPLLSAKVTPRLGQASASDPTIVVRVSRRVAPLA
jgi:hypothetical protein